MILAKSSHNRRDHCSTLVLALARLLTSASLQTTNCCIWQVSPSLYKQLPDSFHQPHPSLSASDSSCTSCAGFNLWSL